MQHFIEDIGVITDFCGVIVDYNREFGHADLGQMPYTQAIIYEFTGNNKKVSTPMNDITCALAQDSSILDDCRRLVGKLLWLACHTRPDISFATGVLVRCISAPTTDAWMAAKHVVHI